WDKLIYSFEHSFPVLSDHNRENQLNSKKEWPTVNEPLETSLLRKIICKNQFSSEELIDTLAYFKENDFPNIVCFIQGFRHLDYRLEEKNQTIQLIRAYFEKTFQGVVPRLYFVPYRNYLLVLFRQTENVHSVSHWETGRMLFNQIVHELLTNHKIQIYIGVGTIYNDPLKLYLSCEEAKVARSFPPYRDISLRYYEEVTREPQIVKSMTYIEERLGEEISALEVARYVNLSYSYFVKLFKRETGKNFSGYVTFVRLRRAVWMLRNTDQTIEEISDEVGFNTPNYFSATFKKYIGITPSEFRLTTEILFS
ncbi:MAG TPA: AraC family transcriptional regulator, partial [Chondromyces sp.]|nr:AraC family transcriptional regulator [Chondromyces sp.]